MKKILNSFGEQQPATQPLCSLCLPLATLLALAITMPCELSGQSSNPQSENGITDPESRDKTSADTNDVNSDQELLTSDTVPIPDPKHVGGEPDGIVQVANLVYASTKSSECFADHFLVQAEKDSAISTSRRFHAVKLASNEIYDFPLLIMTGEGEFSLPDQERDNLRQFILRGGFLLASAGCSSQDWDRSFRKEMLAIFPEQSLQDLAADHAVFHTVYDINELKVKHGKPKPLEGISFEGRLGVLYSQDGLNDTAHTTGCCCCGGNEISNSAQINVNILAYALTH